MKKTILQILALIIILSVFAACSNGKGAKDNASETNLNATPAINIDPESDEPEEVEEPGLYLGEIADNSTYTNTYAGISFTVPEAWEFATDEDLAMLTGREMAGLRENRSELLEYATRSAIYDMMAISEDGTATLTVSFDNTALYDLGEVLTEDDYLNLLEEKYAELWGEASRSVIKLGNADYTKISVEYEGMGVYEEIFVRRVDEYIVCIMHMSFGEIPTDFIGECFN